MFKGGSFTFNWWDDMQFQYVTKHIMVCVFNGSLIWINMTRLQPVLIKANAHGFKGTEQVDLH